MAGDRRATPADIDEICGSLPEAWLGTSWGDVPTWLAPEAMGRRGKGRGFVLYRKPRAADIDPTTGEPYRDLLVIRTASALDKESLVEADGPFFTIDHFKGYNAVLIQLSRVSEVAVGELREVIADAWRAVAPKALVRAHPDV